MRSRTITTAKELGYNMSSACTVLCLLLLSSFALCSAELSRSSTVETPTAKVDSSSAVHKRGVGICTFIPWLNKCGRYRSGATYSSEDAEYQHELKLIQEIEKHLSQKVHRLENEKHALQDSSLSRSEVKTLDKEEGRLKTQLNNAVNLENALEQAHDKYNSHRGDHNEGYNEYPGDDESDTDYREYSEYTGSKDEDYSDMEYSQYDDSESDDYTYGEDEEYTGEEYSQHTGGDYDDYTDNEYSVNTGDEYDNEYSDDENYDLDVPSSKKKYGAGDDYVYNGNEYASEYGNRHRYKRGTKLYKKAKHNSDDAKLSERLDGILTELKHEDAPTHRDQLSTLIQKLTELTAREEEPTRSSVITTEEEQVLLDIESAQAGRLPADKEELQGEIAQLENDEDRAMHKVVVADGTPSQKLQELRQRMLLKALLEQYLSRLQKESSAHNVAKRSLSEEDDYTHLLHLLQTLLQPHGGEEHTDHKDIGIIAKRDSTPKQNVAKRSLPEGDHTHLLHLLQTLLQPHSGEEHTDHKDVGIIAKRDSTPKQNVAKRSLPEGDHTHLLHLLQTLLQPHSGEEHTDHKDIGIIAKRDSTPKQNVAKRSLPEDDHTHLLHLLQTLLQPHGGEEHTDHKDVNIIAKRDTTVERQSRSSSRRKMCQYCPHRKRHSTHAPCKHKHRRGELVVAPEEPEVTSVKPYSSSLLGGLNPVNGLLNDVQGVSNSFQNQAIGAYNRGMEGAQEFADSSAAGVPLVLPLLLAAMLLLTTAALAL